MRLFLGAALHGVRFDLLDLGFEVAGHVAAAGLPVRQDGDHC